MKRIIFWASFIVVLGLIIWGLSLAMEKDINKGSVGDAPAVTANDHILGPEDAKVTIIEYSDFECPACRAYQSLVKKVIASSTIPVRLVYRHFPLSQHTQAKLAARVTEAAALQGKFFEMHDIIFDNQSLWTNRSNARDLFMTYGQRIGLNVDKLNTDTDSVSVKRIVDDAISSGIDIGIRWTPTFFVNGKLLENNPQSYEEFKRVVEEAAWRN